MTARVWWVAGLIALTAVAGCGSGSGGVCPYVLMSPSVGLGVQPPIAARVRTATLALCPEGTGDGCPQPGARVPLHPGANGTKIGSLGLALTAGADYEVVVELFDAPGRRVLRRQLTITPEEVGRQGCDNGGPTASVTISG